MTQNINLKELEKKAFTSYHQDGLLDIVIGLYILGFGMGILADMLWLPIFLYPGAFFVWLAAKKSLTVPRIGYVKFGPERHSQMRKLLLIGVVALSLMVVMSTAIFYGSATGTLPQWVSTLLSDYIMVFIGVIGALLLVLAGYFLQITRLYIYAGAAFVTFGCGNVVNAPISTGALVVGSVILLSGVFMLLQFVRKYPAKGT